MTQPIDLFLKRTEQAAQGGTFGWLLPFNLHTVEDDWRANLKGQSCIPAGTYRLVRTIYHKHGYETFEVTGVPGRSRILIHPANTENDVEGCIGVGLRRGHLWLPDEDDPAHPVVKHAAIVESRPAFNAFMAAMHNVDEAHLTIEWITGLPEEGT